MNPASVLIVATRRLGDVLLATPVVRSVRSAWPATAIDVLVFTGTEDVLNAHPDLRRVLAVAERPSSRAHTVLLRSIFQRYDIALSLLCGDRPVFYARLAGRTAVAPVLPGAKHWWKRRLLSASIPFDGESLHTVLMNLRLGELIGVPSVPSVEPSWTELDRKTVSTLLPFPLDTPFAVLHPSPKFAYKQWHDVGWRDLSRWFAQRGLRTVLTGGPDIRERSAAASLLPGMAPGTVDLTGRMGLAATACLVANARAYVGPDTVVTHIAAAVGVPTVALFGPSNPVKWGPWPRGHGLTNPYRLRGTQRVGNVLLIQGTGDCVPCFKEGCDRHIDSDSACLKGLTAGTVIGGLERLLGDVA